MQHLANEEVRTCELVGIFMLLKQLEDERSKKVRRRHEVTSSHGERL